METVSTGVLDKNKEHYLRNKDRAKKSCIKTYTIAYVKILKKRIYTIHYVKPTAQLLFKSRFPKSGQTYRRQVVNPRHQTPQGQSVAKPETPLQNIIFSIVYDTVYPMKYAHSFRFAVLCCGYTLTDFPISIRLISLALWQSNDCPSASKATLMNMDKYIMWIHYERLHNHNKAKHNKTVCIFLGIYCMY